MPLPRPPRPPRWRPPAPPRRRGAPGQITATIPGFKPDYGSLIENDPIYHQFHQGQIGASATDKARRNAGIIRELVKFGQLPDLQGIDLGDFGLDDATLAAIRANQNPNTSTTARLARDHDVNVRMLQAELAARGMLRSGALGVGLNLEQQRFEGEQTNERQKLLDFLAGLQSAFADAESGRATDNATQASEATQRLMDSGLYKPRDAKSVKAKRDPSTGLYVDPAGNYYDRDGRQVFDPQFRRVRMAARPPRRPGPPRPPVPYNPGYRP